MGFIGNLLKKLFGAIFKELGKVINKKDTTW